MDNQECSVAWAIWNGTEPACCVRENIRFFLDRLDFSCPRQSSENFNRLGYEASLLSSSLLLKKVLLCQTGFSAFRIFLFAGPWSSFDPNGCPHGGCLPGQVYSLSGSWLLWDISLSPPEPTWAANHLSLVQIGFLGLLAAYWLACSKLRRHVFLWKLRVCSKLGTSPPIELQIFKSSPEQNFLSLPSGTLKECNRLLCKSGVNTLCESKTFPCSALMANLF